MVDPAGVEIRLGLRLVLPVVEPISDREGQRARHVDKQVPPGVGPASLQYQDRGGRIGAEPVGKHASRGSAADDDEVVALHGSWLLGKTRASNLTNPSAQGPANVPFGCLSDEIGGDIVAH